MLVGHHLRRQSIYSPAGGSRAACNCNLIFHQQSWSDDEAHCKSRITINDDDDDEFVNWAWCNSCSLAGEAGFWPLSGLLGTADPPRERQGLLGS